MFNRNHNILVVSWSEVCLSLGKNVLVQTPSGNLTLSSWGVSRPYYVGPYHFCWFIPGEQQVSFLANICYFLIHCLEEKLLLFSTKREEKLNEMSLLTWKREQFSKDSNKFSNLFPSCLELKYISWLSFLWLICKSLLLEWHCHCSILFFNYFLHFGQEIYHFEFEEWILVSIHHLRTKPVTSNSYFFPFQNGKRKVT